MIPEEAVWAIFLIPLAAFLLIALILRPFFSEFPRQSGAVAVIAIAASLALSGWALYSVINSDQPVAVLKSHEWLSAGALQINIGLMVDPLTAIMLVVVTGVSLMVQVYSLGYMREHREHPRYFAIMCLFTASMVGLVISSSIIQLYVFWELVGVCSYLLIGFWYQRPAAAAAAKKAFIVTRIGDFGLLIAILYLFFNSSAFGAENLSSLEIVDIQKGAREGLLGGMAMTWIAAGIFAGAVGKSAQFPLHVWLPDAMEGPTPVSALIHAATMVAAGVFLVARFFDVFLASTEAMSMVAIVGATTAVFAATMGLVSNDIKKVLAYSTISQLGFMMAALGVGAYTAAIFHMFNHAFFKALLFMGAGSVNHATGTFDMRYMGGLRKVMPLTYVTVLLGAISLVGIFPFSGFWSKDEILVGAWDGWRGDSLVAGIVFWALMAGVFMTAAYTFRLVHMTFHGQFRGGVDKETEDSGSPAPAGESHGVHLAESPWTMVAPMIVLGIAAVVSGYLANPSGFSDNFLGIDAHWFTHFFHSESHINVALAVITVAVAAGGILVTAGILLGPKVSVPGTGAPLRGLHRLLSERYYMDHLYEGQIVYRGFYRGLCASMDWFDRRVVDNVAEFVGWSSRSAGQAVRVAQTGQVQGYAVAITVGVTLIVGAYLIWG